MTGGRIATGMKMPPSRLNSSMVTIVAPCADSCVASVPTSSPIAANGSTPAQPTARTCNQVSTGRSTPMTAPTTSTSASAGSATSIATAALTARYPQAGSGVSRNWRFHPSDRSVATSPPVLTEAVIAPKAAMLSISATRLPSSWLGA
jgi:hypothetical protein